MHNIRLTIEEKLLIKILFLEQKICKKDLNKIDLEKLIKIGSKSLMIPSLYKKITDKNYSSFFELEFIKYIRYIYELNKERNNQLLREIYQIRKILTAGNIEFAFLKGAALILNKTYNDFGERMIGDIDILINENDYIEAISIFKKHGYSNKKKIYFFERHFPRMVSSKKTFAVELHKRVLRKENNKLMNTKIIFNKKINKKKKILSHEFLILNNIYNFEINDYGYTNNFFDLRTIYDTLHLMNFKDINIKKINLNKYTRKHFQNIQQLEIRNYKIRTNINDIFWLYHHNICKKFKSLSKLNKLIVNASIYLSNKPMQIKEFVINKKYRKYIFKKLIKN